ncbi:hypothetical protein OROGR_008746 [Orobanche gracilis]
MEMAPAALYHHHILLVTKSSIFLLNPLSLPLSLSLSTFRVRKLNKMERNSLCSTLKQEGISNSANSIMNYKFKGSTWDFGNDRRQNSAGNRKEGDLMAAGFSWPPRSYICSFCRREFRSAQALGGHMNVHRRDRAILRLSPSTRDYNNDIINIIGGNKNAGGGHFPTVNLNLDPNPSLNSNPNLPSRFTKFPRFTSALPPIFGETKRFDVEDAPVPVRNINSGMLTADLIETKGRKGLFGDEKFDSFGVKKGREIFKKGDQFIRLDLEIGLFSQSDEELDLELRLGYT